MKKILLASCIAVFAMGTTAVAQNGTTTTATPQVSVQDEIRTTSGELKEAYGILSQDLARLDREIGPNADAATPAQAATRASMKTTLTQLEGMLSTVNTAGGAACSNANFPKGQRQIIRDYYQLLAGRRQFVLRHQTRDCFATQVHEGLRLNEFRDGALDITAPDAGLTHALRYFNPRLGT